MKVLFVADNEPVKEMFQPIIGKLSCQSVVVNKADIKAIKWENPDVVVVAREETRPEERAIVDSGIPILLVPHGALMPNEKQLWVNGGHFRLGHWKRLAKQGFWKLRKRDMPISRLLRIGLFRMRHDFRDGKTLSRYNGYSKIAAYGEAMRDILIRYGVEPSNIVITGNPKYAKYLNIKPYKSGKVLLITDYLVGFGLWSKNQRLNYLRDVCDVAYGLTKKRLEILAHPVLEDKKEYESLVESYELPANVYQMELARLIDECDVAITVLSTSGLEVMVAGKPLVVYNPYDNPTLYDDNSGAYITYTKEELRQAVGELLENGISANQRRLADDFVYRQAYLVDGKSAERIADLIMSMAKGDA